ncbi:MAG: Hsp20/alpha crystallin family protein [Candidatus Cloacimonetes bacterium]|nr:Hsp20/alpha crystallin family protein [Candidatus Cloacimonadota bacterium]
MKIVPFKREHSLWPSVDLFENFMNRFFEDDADISDRMMAIDVIEHNDRFEIKANLPGFKKSDIAININDNQLIIEAKREETKEENKGTYCRCERYQGNYRRVLSLPDLSNSDKIEGKFENGVLIINIPKVEPKPAKEITIA